MQVSDSKTIWNKNSILHVCVLNTCTMEFSGIGVIVLNVLFICSKQRGTYFSNSIVRWALSVWRSRWSIQLATYLNNTRAASYRHDDIKISTNSRVSKTVKCNSRVPAQVLLVNEEDSCSRYCGRSGHL